MITRMTSDDPNPTVDHTRRNLVTSLAGLGVAAVVLLLVFRGGMEGLLTPVGTRLSEPKVPTFKAAVQTVRNRPSP